jgi:hypothetical protein
MKKLESGGGFRMGHGVDKFGKDDILSIMMQEVD